MERDRAGEEKRERMPEEGAVSWGVQMRAEAQRYLDECDELRDRLRIAPSAALAVEPLAAGEHNMNYTFSHPETGKRYVLRVNCAAQMDTPTSPSRYEYNALRILEPSGRTPTAYYVDDSYAIIDRGVLVMSFLPGRQLVYDRQADLSEAARVLADVHAVPAPEDSGLVTPADPLRDQFEECERMFARYRGTPFEEASVVRFVERFFECASEALATPLDPRDCCHIQNTETTADQFLLDDGAWNDDGVRDESASRDDGSSRNVSCGTARGYLIDWEKPIVGEVAQDVAYFLAPTSTIWQDGPILADDVRDRFVDDYWRAVDGRFPRGRFEERFRAFFMMNNLRGVTWCCQAMVDYHDPNRPLKHDDTYRRLGRYLGEDFLRYLDRHVFAG